MHCDWPSAFIIKSEQISNMNDDFPSAFPRNSGLTRGTKGDLTGINGEDVSMNDGCIVVNGNNNTNTNGDFADYEEWDAAKLAYELTNYSVSPAVVDKFREKGINGTQLKHLSKSKFKEMGQWTIGEWLDICNFREKLNKENESKKAKFRGNLKIFNDPIHGNIHLNPVCIAIIDTPQFQRLRYLKQLGLVYFVYPGAAHNRFEHSLGVCYLAGQYVRSLKENQSYLGITDQDVLCVEIAGLCHDLGHGPFSHTFDQMFIPTVKPDASWMHEHASKDMFDYLVKENGLDKEDGIFKKHGLTDIDMTFIKELIAPKVSKPGEWPHTGRPKEKAYLYEIVANKRNNIDVDKWDYMARDCHQLGIRNNFDHHRFIKFARVISVNDELQICLRDKEVLNLYNMFSTRYTLHKIAYQHQVASAMALMVARALVKANNHMLLTGKDGKKLKMSECINDMVAYTHLTDDILFKILDTDSEDEDMRTAKELIKRLFDRDLYKCVFQSKPIDPVNLKDRSETRIAQEIVEISGNELRQDDFVVEIVHLDFGMNDENPVERLNVYSKHDLDNGKRFSKEEASRILTANYTELLLRVYSCELRKNRSRGRSFNNSKSKVISDSCLRWFEQNFPD